MINNPIMMKGGDKRNIFPKILGMNILVITILFNLIINPLNKFPEYFLKQSLIFISN